MRPLLTCALLCCLLPLAGRGELPQDAIRKLDSLVESGLRAGYYPGASLVVGDRNGISYERQYGHLDYTKARAVQSTDLYDIASCSKVMGTTFAAMWLYDQGKIALEQRVDAFLPDYRNTPVGTLTLTELLTHTSGIAPHMLYANLVRNATDGPLMSGKKSEQYPYQVEPNLYMARDVVFDTTYISARQRPNYRRLTDTLWINPAIDTLIRRQILRAYKPALRGKYSYNDSNFHLLKQIIEKVSGQTLDSITRLLYHRLGAIHTGYNPLAWQPISEIAPTETDYMLRRYAIRGKVHDELAMLSGGIGGNAGLFSTASDMARFCEMILNKGTYHGAEILKPSTVERFTAQPLASKGIYRALGFDSKRSAPGVALQGVGHTGFTGVIFWINPRQGQYMVFLSNSVHPTRLNSRAFSSSMLRTKLWDVIYSSSPTAPR